MFAAEDIEQKSGEEKVSFLVNVVVVVVHRLFSVCVARNAAVPTQACRDGVCVRTVEV